MFREIKLSGSNIKKFLTFSQKMFFFYISGNSPKIPYISEKDRNILIFQETFYISGSNFRSLKNEKKSTLKNVKKNVF